MDGAPRHRLGLQRRRARRPGEAHHGHGKEDLRQQARYPGKLKVEVAANPKNILGGVNNTATRS